ncbi:ABC transporter substrate-binding protein [Nocardioides soli]|uniref:Thiamine pyrimidine synthase n=1 Tax=Nocardioides soli TaxID=1036020 RepID=A0A7W4VV27_9ACTN|nr:ABC transporter substrate-binding protein [Nocardioides soli]MBB3042294.1 NitT/TauT family transport system substrate-binding protein [Nocardioides soli]
MAEILFGHAGSTRPGPRRAAVAVLAAVLAAAGLAACGDRESTRAAAVDSSIEVQVAWLPNVQAAGEYVADAKGFYDDAGLDVHLTPGGPNANPVQLVAAGKADVGVTYAPSLMLARNEDIPVKAFGAAMQKAPLAYFSLADEGITSVADLAGKKVGIQVGGETLLESMLRNNGMTLDDVKTVTVGSDITPLLQGQVDAFAAWEINLEQLAPAEGTELNKLLLFENGTKFQSNYYIATDAALDGDISNLTAFLQASAEGWQYALDHPEEAVDILMEVNPALNRDLQLEQLTEYLPDYVASGGATTHGFGWMDEAMWKSTVADFQSFGIIKDDLAPQDMYTMDVLEAADLGAESSK